MNKSLLILMQEMENCEQTKGLSILQHGLSVR